MDKILRDLFITFAFILLLPTLCVAADSHFKVAEKSTRADLSHILQKSKTVGDFIAKIKPSVDHSTLTFLQSKIKGAEKTKIKISENNNKQYTIETGNSLVVFSIERKEGENIILTLNHKKIEYHPSRNIESFWDAAIGSLPQKTASLLSHILPEAHAVEPIIVMASIAAISIGSSMYFINKTSCTQLSIYYSSCTENGNP
ncbi:MAG: hypothetical protein KDD38_09545 [Bdellovibrionales bacterium]|nr:hypothetical protein [Bdellovibrionales bacterium]